MYFVYFLQSSKNPKKTYIGFTENTVEERLDVHNACRVPHTSRHAPWELIGYVAVRGKKTALDLERYFKTGSGHAFWHKRFGLWRDGPHVPCGPCATHGTADYLDLPHLINLLAR